MTWLAIDPGNNHVLYEYDYGETLRKSLDGGHTWKVVLSGFRRFGIRTLLMPPRAPLALYAAFSPNGPRGGKPGVYKSMDGGKHWWRLGLPAPGDLVLSAADPQKRTIYFTEGNQVFASTDAGRYWRSIGQGLPHDQPVSALGAGGGTVIASLGTAGVYISTNQGQTWTRTWPASGTAPGLGVGLLTIDPAHPTTVLAAATYAATRATGTHILRSTDGGHTWEVAG